MKKMARYAVVTMVALLQGTLTGIMILPDGSLQGAADNRRLGQAFGY